VYYLNNLCFTSIDDNVDNYMDVSYVVDLISNGIYMMFARTAVGLEVVDIIGEHIPEV